MPVDEIFHLVEFVTETEFIFPARIVAIVIFLRVLIDIDIDGPAMDIKFDAMLTKFLFKLAGAFGTVFAGLPRRPDQAIQFLKLLGRQLL